MTCPYCHVVSSRFSDVCTDCGAHLRFQASVESAKRSFPLAPPELPQPTLQQAVPTATFVRPEPQIRSNDRGEILNRSRIPLKAPIMLLGIGVFVLASRSLFRPPMSQPPAPPPVVFSSPYSPQVLAPHLLAPPLENFRETPQMASNAAQELRHPPQQSSAGLHLERDSFTLSLSSSPDILHMQNTYSVPQATRSQISGRYQSWKQRHEEDASQVQNLLDLYAPDAKIFPTPKRLVSVDGLRALAIQVRNGGFFSSVDDQKAPQWAQNRRGDEVELLAYQRYSDDGGNLLWGQRRLVWKKRGGKWLIIRDDFPPQYFRQKPTSSF